jgi:DNA polymerase lambda
LQLLASVWGVGPKLAQKLYQAGHRSIEDLEKEPSLSQMARIGVKYHNDLLLRIPRDEVATAEAYVQKIAANLCEGVICGQLCH